MSDRRYERPDPRLQVQLSERDRTFLVRMCSTGITSATGTALLWNSAAPQDAAGFQRRLRQLHRAGYVCRFHPGMNPTMEGTGKPDCIALEYGSAGVLIDAGVPLDRLPKERVDRLTTLAEGDRTRLLEVLARLPMATVTQRLKNASEQIKHILDGSKSVTHDLLTSDFLALLCLTAARSDGHLAVSDIALDNEVFLRATVTEKDTLTHRTVETKLLRKPDAVAVVVQDGTRIALLLESETGTSAKHKILKKLTEYRAIKAHLEATGGKQAWHQAVASAAGTAPVDAVRLVFYCATDAHVQTVTEATQQVFKNASAGMVVIVPKSAVAIDAAAKEVYENTVRPDGVPTLTYLSKRLLSPVCRIVGKQGLRLEPLFSLPVPVLAETEPVQDMQLSGIPE